MPDTTLKTNWDLRQEGARQQLTEAVTGCFKTKKKGSPFACREIAEYVGASMAQTRTILNDLIVDEGLQFAGTTRSTVYFT